VNDTIPVEDAVSTTAGGKRPLYAPRIPIYPKRVAGTFRRLKWVALIVLLAIYYVTPWLRWDRGPGAPDQAVLVDLPNRRAYFFFIEIWPQEVYYLVGLLVLGAIGLFFATALAGRVWCGYACPQTVWTDLYMWVERLIEGDRNARIKLDRRPLSVDKAAKKTLKHGLWLLIAFVTGGAWIMYFNDAPTVVRDIFTLRASDTVYFFTGLFTATTYLLAGWAREQVCTYMCPYARFQGAMFDDDTLIVTYQAWRGEPRGKHKKGQSWAGRGHCVDCNQCVAVCPMGIDIRDGQQLECIGCALCIDACDAVMDKLDLPRGLGLGLALERLAPRISQHLLGSADVMDDAAQRHDPVYQQALEKLTLAWAEGRKVRVWHRHEKTGRVFEYAFAPYFIEPYAVGHTTHVIGELMAIEQAKGKLAGLNLVYTGMARGIGPDGDLVAILEAVEGGERWHPRKVFNR
jgi:polyferredoxin